jgi:heme/copper-type cytochrome/quinol oxidase subunit 4
MRPRMSLVVLFLLLAACVPLAAAQNAGHGPTPDQLSPRHFDAFWLGMRVDLGPDWLFSPDDNPAYASPTYDDSGWKTISANKRLTDYGIRNIPYAWYRIHVHVSPRWHDLAVEVQYIAGSYELYVNGVRIGANGKMVGMLKSEQDYLTAYDIPDSMIAPNGDLVIAIRFAISKMDNFTPGTSTPLTADCIFLTNREATARDASYEATHQIATYLILFGLNLVVGIVAFALYMAMRSQPEYLAISIALLATSLQSAVTIWSHLHAATTTDDFLAWIAIGIVGVANIEFVRLIARLRRTRWLLALEIILFMSCFIPPLNYSALWTGYSAPVLYYIPALTSASLLPALLIWSARRGNRDARFFIPPFAFIGFLNVWNVLGGLCFIFHLALKIPPIPYFHLAGYGFSLWDVWTIVYCVTMLLFLVLRTIGIARERAQAAAELEAARTVQQVLVPAETPSVAGFAIHSVYKPAGQVGGDFFQILPLSDGGVLAVIGDVSGKGMPAAMTVSLLVGTVRTLAHYTQSPSEILAAMNQRMMARSGGGFTTCLVLRADTDGTLTIANAGHISPYLNGKELAVQNSLPLGLAANTTYAESSFQLPPNQQLTLLSDGVVEARDKTGALYGFGPTAALSIQSAESIAEAAQAFGQNDDITVLTLARLAPARMTAAEQTAPILLPA